MRFKAEIGLV